MKNDSLSLSPSSNLPYLLLVVVTSKRIHLQRDASELSNLCTPSVCLWPTIFSPSAKHTPLPLLLQQVHAKMRVYFPS